VTIAQVSDVIVPSVYAAYLQRFTEQKSQLVQSGALARDGLLDGQLAGGGMSFNYPRWRELADTAANVSSGSTGSPITPLGITTDDEIAVRVSRNQGWGAVDLAEALAGDDPMRAIAARVAPYWTRRLQDMVLAILKGVFADNVANDSSDMTWDISGSAYSAGVTDFSAQAFIDCLNTIGDSEADLGVVVMHSMVYNRARKNNLIDFIPDSQNPAAAQIPIFLGRQVLVDDGMPVTSNVYTTYLCGRGALRLGAGTPKVPLESMRQPLDANGGGSEYLVSRVEWCVHPLGMKFAGSISNGGGPTDAATSNNFGAAGSWDRVAPERKMVKMAQLITREA
jgi:hypothetical protein